MEDNKCTYNPEMDCIMEHCVMEHRIEHLEDEMKQNKEAHKIFYDKIERVNLDFVSLQKDVSNISRKVDEIYLDLKALSNIPNKRYETIVTAILTAIVGAFIGYCMKI